MNYKLGSLFDGSGGFPLAGALCGIEPVWASEIEPYPIAVTKSRMPDVKHLGDISKINGAELEPVDIITFGSPCQDLSVAGKRAGLKHENNGDDETTRSGLFIEAVRIIKEMREKTNGEYPRFALWENVPGAFSSNKGEDFRIVLEELIKIVEPTAVMPEVPKFGWAYADSYCGNGWSLAYRVLDAQYWGVPQRRRRIYLVADFRGESAREILFEREGLRGYFTEGRTPWQAITAHAKRCFGADDREGEKPYTLKIRSGCEGGGKGALIQEDKSATLACNNDQYLFQPTCYGISAYESNSMKSSNPHSGVYEADTSRTLDLNGGNPACNQGGIAVVEPIAVATQQGGAEVTDNGVCPTITAAAGMSGNNQPWICHPDNDGKTCVLDSIGGNAEYGFESDVSPCLKATHYKMPPCITQKIDSNILDDQGGSVINIRTDGKAPTLRAQMGGHPPVVLQPAGFCPEQSEKTRGIGYEEETSPTLRAGVTPGVVYGVDAYNQALTGDKAKTLNSAASDSDHVPCVAYSIENHPNDSRVKIDDEGKVQALTSRMGTGGGNVPLVMETFCKSHRAQTADDATTWKHGKVANTLNTFDQGEARANELVVETVALEGNGQRPSHRGDGYAVTDKSYTLNSTEVHGVAYSFDPSASRDVGTLFIEECSKTLTNGTCPGHHDGVVIAEPILTASKASFFMNTDEELASTLVATDYKDPQMVCYREEEPIAIDRAFFNQGKNALYEPQTYEDGTVPTLVAKGPSAVAIRYIVRRLTPTECARLQGFADRWGDIDSKSEFSDEEYKFWLEVRNTHAAINGKAVKEYTKAQMLTWYNKLHTDSAEYKLWGNGIALPTALYVVQGISDVMKGAYK